MKTEFYLSVLVLLLFAILGVGSINGQEGLLIIIFIVGLLFVFGITVGLYVLVAVMAQKRNRSVVVWVLLSLLATPLLMIIILLVIGKNENYIENHYDR